MGEKDKILAKLNIKDYKNELELILEEKQFDEEAKSLLLSVFYKLDNFYKDYTSVKKDTEIKNQCLETYINIIKTKCKTIKLIKPQELKQNNKYEVDKKAGKIVCVPNELILLFSVYQLSEKEIDDAKYLLADFTRICVANILNKGKTINATEPIRDFNGWSWNVQIDNSLNIIYNLIFQNLLILFGYKFTNENMNKSNIIESFNLRANKDGLGGEGEGFLTELFRTCVILYNNQSSENHAKCLNYKKSLVNKKNMLINRKEYVDDKNKDSSNISKQIKMINEMLSDIKLIRNEYEKCINQNSKAFFCISDFVESKENERQNLLGKIKENNKVLKEKKYLSQHDDFNFTLELYELIGDKQQNVNVQPVLLNLQKKFLECIIVKINQAEQKKELFNLILQLRYYCNLLYKKEQLILSQEKLKPYLKKTIETAISKLIELKVVETGFKSEKLNNEILKYIFKTRMIELEMMNLKISIIENNKIQVEYYDSKELEAKEILELPNEEEITSKKDVKIKLFKLGG